MNIGDLIKDGTFSFFANFFELLISFFGSNLSDLMSTAINVLDMPLVVNVVKYAQILAIALLVVKAGSEIFTTYILYENGDPDADPAGVLVRTAQAAAIIFFMPWLIREIFTFGTKVAKDVAMLRTGSSSVSDWSYITGISVASQGSVFIIFMIIILVMLLIISIQAAIRGAELALMSVLGSIMALNLTANNRSIWSAWLRQVIIICVSQALQIFMISGALSLMINRSLSSNGMFIVFGWLWVTIKTPNYVKQFAYSTGLTSSIGGAAKQAGSMVLMRKIMTKGA